MGWKFDSAFPDRLRTLREAIGVSQTVFAERMGVTRATVSYYENGDRIPDIQFLDKVINETCVCYDYLMGYSAAMRGTFVSTYSELNDAALESLKEFNYYEEDIAGINLILGHPAFQEFVKLVGLVATGQLGGAAVNYELDYAAICEYKLFAIMKKIFAEAVRLGSAQPQGDGLDNEDNTIPAIKEVLSALDVEKKNASGVSDLRLRRAGQTFLEKFPTR